MNKTTRAHYDRLAALGCVACLIDGYADTPAEIHHIRAGTGMGQRSKQCLPLCPPHHRGTNHPLTPSIHLSKINFTLRYGSEAELLDRVNTLLGE